MNRLTKYFFIFHTIMILTAGVGMWIVLKLFFPEMMVKGYFVIPLFFYLMGVIFILRFRRTPLENPAHLVNLYMIMRVIKIFTSFAIIFLYWLIHQPSIRNFATLFIIFYLISLIWETYIYLRMEKYIKNMKEENKHPNDHECIDL
ncbi:MAG: hypothetical protein GX680_08275 [Bacteroidales bacterium]|nr:hypothetical protein [Bacteroidales bacterium]